MFGLKYKFGNSKNNPYITLINKMVMTTLRVMVNVIVFTCIIGLAVSYLSTLLYPYVPKVNFLEAVGLYCLWTPIHHGLMAGYNRKDLED